MADSESSAAREVEGSEAQQKQKEGYDGGCIFCKIVNGEMETELLHQDEITSCFRDIKPAAPHHYLVVPTKHRENCKTLSKEDIPLVEKLVETGKAVLEKNNVTDLNDVKFGFHLPPFQSVAHLHLHVLAPASQIGFLSRFIYRQNSFWFITEIKALLSLLGRNCVPSEAFNERSPFWRLHGLSEDDVRSVMARTVCAKSAFELWGDGRTVAELKSSLLAFPTESMSPFLQEESTYMINVYTFNKTLEFKDRIKKIDALDFLPFKGKVRLKDPDHVFCLLEDYGLDPNDIPDEPLHMYFGRWVADGQRELIRSHSVKKRHFIGNTSMDAGLSFIMANHAKVKPHDLVYDPFVGTGSLLVACSHFGAYVCGTDIDYNTIHGVGKASRKNQKWRGPDENIRANLRQYGTECFYVDVMVSDASKPAWRKGALFDAIITDPPYGIRESTRRTGSHKGSTTPPDNFAGDGHVPVSMAYHLSDIFADLLNFAALHLVLGGRLVYWLPVYRPEYSEETVPSHPCLTLISNSEQTLSSHTSRRLITMEKIKQPEKSDALARLADPRSVPYHGHNSFREKYFSGVTKKNEKANERMKESD